MMKENSPIWARLIPAGPSSDSVPGEQRAEGDSHDLPATTRKRNTTTGISAVHQEGFDHHSHRDEEDGGEDVA